MHTKLNPYLSFQDNAREAITFYQQVFGGKLEVDTFGENGMSDDPSEADKVMHAQLVTDGGMVLMASDTPAGTEYRPNTNGSISLSGDDQAELQGYYDKLSTDGGTVALPLEKAPWGDYFGMCVDQFGVNWMVNISGKGGDDGSTTTATDSDSSDSGADGGAGE